MKNVKQAISMQIKDEKSNQNVECLYLLTFTWLYVATTRKKYFKFGIQFHSHISLLWDFCQKLNKMHASIYCCGRYLVIFEYIFVFS